MDGWVDGYIKKHLAYLKIDYHFVIQKGGSRGSRIDSMW
jgi:DNA-binding NarL/FixJ family response regulator